MAISRVLYKIFILVAIPVLSDALEIRTDDVNALDHPNMLGLKGDELSIATKLLETYKATAKIQNEFQNAFYNQQDLMAQMSTGHKSIKKNRFMQVKEPADPQQIWRGLYDTQAFRSPPQMTLHVFDGEDTEKIGEEASAAAAQAEAAAMENKFQETAKAFQAQGTTEMMNKEIMNQIKEYAVTMKPTPITKPRVASIFGSREGPRPFHEPKAPRKHPPPEAIVPLASGEIPCAGTVSLPVFRQKDEQLINLFPVVDGTSEADRLQVVSPFMPTVTEQGAKSIPADDIPAGYYGESRITK